MSKKKSSSTSSLKKLSQAGDKPAIQPTKQVPKPGKLGIEIDEIFAGRKKKKPEVENPKQVPKPGRLGIEIDDIFAGRKKKKPEVENPDKKETTAEIAKKKRKRKELDGGFNSKPKSRPRKRTGEGFLVYTEEELGFNKADAGDTPLCPFDCNCCF